MITVDTRIEGFDARSWQRLVTLVVPALASQAPHEFNLRASNEGGLLFVLYHQDRILRTLHTQRGVVDAAVWPGADGMQGLAREHGAHWVVAAEAGAIEELYERIGGRLRMDDDTITSSLVFVGALRELYDEGAFHIWPKIVPQHIPLPTAAVVQRTLDFVLPQGESALIALFDSDVLDTAVLIHRGRANVDAVYGPEVIREMVGPLGGDFRRDYKVIRKAIEREVGTLAFGLFSETSTVRTLLRTPSAGAWGQAIASREVILDPMPGWIAVAAGAGVLRAAAQRSKGILEGLGVLGALTPAVRRVREVAETVAGFDVEKMLGFNPLRVWAEVIRNTRQADDSHEP